MKKIRLLVFGVLIFGALGVSYLTLNRQVPVREKVELAQIEEERPMVALRIDFGPSSAEAGDEIIEENMELVEGETAFGVLQKVVAKREIEMETKQYDFGVFVQSIDGHESGADLAWIYYVNGESGNVAADQLELKSGDMVEWKYIEPNF